MDIRSSIIQAVIGAILGHADLKTTQIYCYISQANVKAAYCKFAA